MTSAVRSLAESIDLQEALTYFAAVGWAPTEHPNNKLFVLRPTDHALPQVELILPRNRAAMDFVTRLVEAACVVGRILEIDAETILKLIQTVTADVLRARLLSIIVERRSLPLDTAQIIVGSLKDLVIYGASSESTPLPFFTKPTKVASRHIHHCRFGHTFDGSFGFTIESPLVPAMQEILTPEAAPPFERRVIERIYHGVELVRVALEQHQIEPLVQQYETGLNANMCDALVAMQERIADLHVEYAVDWSPKVPVSNSARGRIVHIGPEAYDYLREAARILRSTEPPKSALIEGRVVILKSDSPPWEDEPSSPHTVVIAWISPEGKPTRTRVVLQPQDYLLACDAHKNGTTVSVQGTLERRGKFSRLTDPSNFRPGRQMNLMEGIDVENE